MRYVIPILIFALFDFFGYNVAVKLKLVNEKFINPYRIIQGLVQIGITVYLFTLNWKYAFVFNLLWWTWTADWIYYFFCISFGFIFGITKECTQPFKNIVTWAWWTPYGLLFSNKTKVIKWYILLIQSVIGIFLTILINK